MVAIPTTPDRPQPVIYNLATDYARYGITKVQRDEILNNCFWNRNGYGRPEFIVLHVQDGKTWGSLLHWASVSASSTVMAQKDGSILLVIPEQHGPWTNGDVDNPTPEANELIAMGGNENNWCFTLEAEGGPWDVMPQAQFDAIVWQVEDWIIREPRILEHIVSILRHGWINSVDRPNCPGNYFAPVLTAINTWLDGAITMPPEAEVPEVPAPPSIYPEGMSEELAKRLYGSVTVPWSSKVFEFDPTRSECKIWLARSKAQIPEGGTWADATWPEIDDIIRRGDGRIHVYRWNNGDVYEKIIR